jgi:hypothetical protein
MLLKRTGMVLKLLWQMNFIFEVHSAFFLLTAQGRFRWFRASIAGFMVVGLTG